MVVLLYIARPKVWMDTDKLIPHSRLCDFCIIVQNYPFFSKEMDENIKIKSIFSHLESRSPAAKSTLPHCVPITPQSPLKLEGSDMHLFGISVLPVAHKMTTNFLFQITD